MPDTFELAGGAMKGDFFEAGHVILDSEFAMDYRRKKLEPAFGINAGIQGYADFLVQIILML
jgi:hypothetical protein